MYHNGFWYVCVKPECNEIPFSVSQSDLDDGEGQVACEICGECARKTDVPQWLLDLIVEVPEVFTDEDHCWRCGEALAVGPGGDLICPVC